MVEEYVDEAMWTVLPRLGIAYDEMNSVVFNTFSPLTEGI